MLLPAPERRHELHFYLAKSLPYHLRLPIAFSLLFLGWAIEYMFLNGNGWLAGIPFILIGISLLLVRGFDNPSPKTAKTRDWRPITSREVQQILELDQKQRQWDLAPIDITNKLGVLVLIALVILLFAIWVRLIYTQQGYYEERYLYIFAANLATFILPFWLTGVRTILKKDRLIIKTKLLLHLEKTFTTTLANKNEQFQYQLQTAEVKQNQAEIPIDIKAVILFPDAPQTFLGLQLQITINTVQGSDYPYFYCVMVAKKKFGSISAKALPPPPKNIILEPSTENDVAIMVIRQKTTKSSGYYTNYKTATKILEYALTATRKLLESRT